MKSALYFLPAPKERHIDQKTFYRTAIASNIATHRHIFYRFYEK